MPTDRPAASPVEETFTLYDKSQWSVRYPRGVAVFSRTDDSQDWGGIMAHIATREDVLIVAAALEPRRSTPGATAPSDADMPAERVVLTWVRERKAEAVRGEDWGWAASLRDVERRLELYLSTPPSHEEERADE